VSTPGKLHVRFLRDRQMIVLSTTPAQISRTLFTTSTDLRSPSRLTMPAGTRRCSPKNINRPEKTSGSALSPTRGPRLAICPRMPRRLTVPSTWANVPPFPRFEIPDVVRVGVARAEIVARVRRSKVPQRSRTLSSSSGAEDIDLSTSRNTDKTHQQNQRGTKAAGAATPAAMMVR